MKTLFLITARGGSKGIPEKNIKVLNGKPLIHYSIDIARHFASDEDICVSTDDLEIKRVVEDRGLAVPFIRPAELATDTSDSYEVIMHAIGFYEKQGRSYDRLMLLQPTSPFRLKKQMEEALNAYQPDLDMLVSVNKSRSNPVRNMFSADAGGYLEKYVKNSNFDRRQDAPVFYELNGAFYVMNVASLKKQKISSFQKLKMVEMPLLDSLDIDTPLDWAWAEFVFEKKLVKLDYE
jgi:CMP-N,N'-diacetyllegionaminic acid synthase